jgi:hypothetical protein
LLVAGQCENTAPATIQTALIANKAAARMLNPMRAR